MEFVNKRRYLLPCLSECLNFFTKLIHNMKSGTERIVRIVGCLMAFFNFLLLVQPINAQTSGKVSVKGVVLDEAGETLPGATVTEKGTKNVAATDLDGKFTIKVSKSGATLIVSYVGYVTKEVTSKPDMKVILSENSKNLDEVVVVGYGTMKKRDVTGAISSISSKDIEQKMATNVFEALQ